MIISKFIPTIGGIAAEVATVSSVILYISTSEKTAVILTFGNAKDRIYNVSDLMGLRKKIICHNYDLRSPQKQV